MNRDEIKERMISVRQEYIKMIKAELLGPGSEFPVPDPENELISSSPITRYSTGILYPQGIKINLDNDEIEINEEEDNPKVEEVFFQGNEEEENHISFTTNLKKDEKEENVIPDDNLDEIISLASQYMPSSMGISFIVKGNFEKIRGHVSFGTYRKAKPEDCLIPFEPENSDCFSLPPEIEQKMIFDEKNGVLRLKSSISHEDIKEMFANNALSEKDLLNLKNRAYRFIDFCNKGYVRIPHYAEFVLDFSSGDFVCDNTYLDGTFAKISALRRRISDNLWSLTLMLVNDTKNESPKASNCIFQPVITIFTENNEFLFAEISPDYREENLDEEESSLNLLYRNRKVYANGLGVSADWKIDSDGRGFIRTEFFPEFEVPQMDFSLPENEKLKSENLSMKFLSDLDPTDKYEKIAILKSLVDLYKSWIEDLEKFVPNLDKRYHDSALRHIKECRFACERMYTGLNVLEENENAYNAFALANRAMFMQRVHHKFISETSDTERYPGDETIKAKLDTLDYRKENDNYCIWRPFQIAFILMVLNSIVNEDSEERNLVDLIWFPTGGGKTEAYLGLTAFTIFYRRLQFPEQSGGTTVIMRYTLRLLTSQQFTRASSLICACEYIRKQYYCKRPSYPVYPLGKERITIGLWIGGNHTPNTNHDAKMYLNELRNISDFRNLSTVKEKNNKFQVLKCPWCGTSLVMGCKDKKLVGIWGYNLDQKDCFYLACPQNECDFSDSLPIQIIDEELYKNPPTLLFGTVDKFAMIAWEGRASSFFATNSKNRAPELIIQDELHLISGALGTIVGLYETALDGILNFKGVSPKIIASTATVRRAKEQCSVLYNRKVVQFPAPGLNADDSFFAREEKISYKDRIFGRKYIGIMPSGKTKAMMEIRAIAALLQKIFILPLPEEVKDKMWTLTTYFNSLKDLGKAFTLVQDDVKDFIIRLSNRLLTPRRYFYNVEELTSRVSTPRLIETLEKIERFEYSLANIQEKRYASDIILASNMISVGIDVPRLNVMLMIGQPKLTSEYIQATSRIGRFYPGVVFVQYDSTKSRDRSHYERFRAYHESFYRYVEPNVATPFSKPARDRALHAVVASIVRHNMGLINDCEAVNVNCNFLKDTKMFILERIDSINTRSKNGTQIDISKAEKEIEEFNHFWIKKAELKKEENNKLYFGKKYIMEKSNAEESCLFKQFNTERKDDAKETLTSMRNVDALVEGKVNVWGK